MLANQKVLCRKLHFEQIIIAQQSYQKIENEVNRLDKEAIILKNYLESTSTVEEYEEPILVLYIILLSNRHQQQKEEVEKEQYIHQLHLYHRQMMELRWIILQLKNLYIVHADKYLMVR